MNTTLSIIRDLKDEQWVDIDGYKGIYQVSNMGRVKSLRRSYIDNNGAKHQIEDRLLKGRKNRNYTCITFSYKGRIQSKNLDRLVAESFLKKIDGKNFLIHVDNNFENNKANNLRWATKTEKQVYEKKFDKKSIIKLDTEVWCDIKGYENIYQISNMGRFRLLERKINTLSGKKTIKSVIKEQRIKNGKSYVRVKLNNIEHEFNIERLVAETFLPKNNIELDKIVHLDKNKLNNKVSNLRWSSSENYKKFNTENQKRFSIDLKIDLKKTIKVSADNVEEAKQKVLDLLERGLINFDFKNDIQKIDCVKN